MEYLEVINLIMLSALTVAFFIQNNKLKILKTIIDAYQPEKIMKAQELIEKGTEHKYNLILSNRVQEIVQESSKQFQEINKTMLSQYNELLNFPINFIKDKSLEEREIYLQHYPKNYEVLKNILTAYDNGELIEVDKEKS